MCGEDQFECAGTGECIDVALLCNTLDDCGDGSDEADCGEYIAPPLCLYNMPLHLAYIPPAPLEKIVSSS